MATVTYYFDNYSASNATNPSYACNDSLADAATSGPVSHYVRYNSNTCQATNLGTITAVYVKPYWANPDAVSSGTSTAFIYTKFSGGTQGPYNSGFTGPFSAQETTYNITSYPSAPSPWSWSDVDSLSIETRVNNIGSGKIGYTYRTRITVTFTPASSTLSWSTPASESVHYRAGSGVSISGTAANANGVYSVEYNVNGGSWVLCSGTTSWSATIPQSSLAAGTNTINTRVRDNSTDLAYTTTDSRNIVMSNIPSQLI